MGRSYFLAILLVSAILTLSFSQGFGRKLSETSKNEVGDFSYQREESIDGKAKPREMIEVTDYPDPEPNTNPRGSLGPPPDGGAN